MEKRPNRKNGRLKNYDYRSKGVYHVTICTNRRECLFGCIADKQMLLNEKGEVVENAITAIPCYYRDVRILSHVVMPNHVHLLVELCPEADAMNGVPTAQHTLGQIISAFKAGVSRKLGCSVWQPRFYEHIIRGERDYLDTVAYIQNNPAAWDKDDYFMSAQP